MKRRLHDYFSQDVRVCSPGNRRVGFEIETLLVDAATGRPISRATSQSIFLRLAGSFDWRVAEVRGDTVVRLTRSEKNDTYTLIYDLGWNNIELISPVWQIEDVFNLGLPELLDRLSDLHSAAAHHGAVALAMDCDGHTSEDTLVHPDARDEIWTKLDGNVLCEIGHIASVHINLDVCSVDEACDFIGRLNVLYASAGWPSSAVQNTWRRYLTGSPARYEPGRYGPPPQTFRDYIAQLCTYKRVMELRLGELHLVSSGSPANPEMDDANLELFLRSVWWWSRLRVRGGQLVLEARAIPRADDAHIVTNTHNVLSTLDLV